jgi:hypothetical protein
MWQRLPIALTPALTNIALHACAAWSQLAAVMATTRINKSWRILILVVVVGRWRVGCLIITFIAATKPTK